MAENLEIAGVHTIVKGIAKFERDIGKYNAAIDSMAKATEHSAAVIYKQAKHIEALEKAAFAVAKELKKVQASEEIVAQSAKKVVAVLRSQVQYTEALEKAALAVAKELKKIQASEQAVAQSTKSATKEVRDFTAAQSEMVSVSETAAKQTEMAAKQTETMAKANDDVDAGLKRHVESLHAQGAAVKDIARFFNMSTAEIQAFLGVQEQTASSVQGTTTAVTDANAAWRNLVKGISQAAKMQVQQEAAQKKQTEAQKKQTTALTGTIARLGLYAIGIRAAYTLISKFRRALADGLKTLYESTAEYKRLTAAIDQFKVALALAAVPADSAADSLRMIAEAVEWFNMALVKSSAFIRASVQSTAALVYMYHEVIKANVALIKGEEVKAERFQEILAFPMSEWVATYNKVIEQSADAMNDAGDAAANYTSQISSMISVMRRWEQASAAVAATAGDIETAYQQAVGVALGDLAVSQMEGQADLADTISGIHAKAAADREQAARNSQLNIERTAKQGLDNLAKMEEQHALQRAHASQRFNLSQIQSERIYQYTRYKLVAEGDVLAIEDLDERHELEQEAAQENFDLQQRQAQAMFDMQLKYQKEALAETVVAMRQAMTEQLRVIDEREQEEIDTARAAAEEKEAAAKEAYASALVDAEAAAIEQRQAQEAEQQALLESTAQTLADMVTNTDLTTQQVLDAWHAVNGPDQALDQMVAELVTRNETWTDAIGDAWGVAADTSLASARRLTDGWATSLGLITANALAAAAAVASIGSGAATDTGGAAYPYRRPTRRQYGGDDVVSTPTTFVAGEAGAERVVVQPLSSVGGGAASMGWRGGPIPVHGSGQLDGMDLSGIGDKVAQQLMFEMNRMLVDYRGQRGR